MNRCDLCGEPMPEGEEMFRHHGYSGPCPAAKIEPLRARTMSLGKLQLETLDLIRKLRFQFQRAAHDPGMSDQEFLGEIVQPIEDKIYADREILRMNREDKSA